MAAKKKSVKKTANGKAKRVVRPIPKGFRTLTPMLNLESTAEFIKFAKKAFGANVRYKMAGPGGKIMHAEIEIGDSVLMASDAMMEPARVTNLCIYVDNVDKTFAKAVKAGATVRRPPLDEPWGDRMARVTDPQGNLWAIGTHIENVKPDELKKRMKAFMKQAAAQ